MKIIGFLILCMYVFEGCSDQRIEITNEYIINENWSKEGEQVGSNSITINRMKVKKDSTLKSFSHLVQEDLLSKLEEDSSFMHYANIKIKPVESYRDKKIYFNRDNGFYWGSKSCYSDDSTKTIGVLQPGNWYRFSDMVSYLIYVYIDSSKKAHCFNVILSNY